MCLKGAYDQNKIRWILTSLLYCQRRSYMSSPCMHVDYTFEHIVQVTQHIACMRRIYSIGHKISNIGDLNSKYLINNPGL